MKKFFSICLMLVMCLTVFVSCGSDNSSELSAEIESLRAENEALKEQMTETTTEATTTTVEETTTTSETEKINESAWELTYYVDDFKRPTDEAFLYGEFKGTFSNSATTNSSLIATMGIERYSYDGEITDSARIQLFEYNSNLVKNFYSKGKYYNIQILEENDNIITESGYMMSEGTAISVWGDKDQNSIINALKNNGKLTFRIDEEDGMDTYLFDVDCTGFKELFESTDWKLDE